MSTFFTEFASLMHSPKVCPFPINMGTQGMVAGVTTRESHGERYLRNELSTPPLDRTSYL